MTNLDTNSQFEKNGHFSEKHVVIHSTNLGCGRLGALICLQYESVCIHMHPYAPICMLPYTLFTPRTPIFNTRFRRQKQKVRKYRNRHFYNAIRSAQSIQIQPTIANMMEIS